eukprot:TRINITY_DN1184_c6_g1_i1.p1 TRINITY_DN1184_c6_g1~~TRINITY_DN1184_c6_g1_i1.p1  ORF type:complete len:396 (+),score=134.77 TRINITY_DN1184_c6_g1_i1:336-1523(+)
MERQYHSNTRKSSSGSGEDANRDTSTPSSHRPPPMGVTSSPPHRWVTHPSSSSPLWVKVEKSPDAVTGYADANVKTVKRESQPQQQQQQQQQRIDGSEEEEEESEQQNHRRPLSPRHYYPVSPSLSSAPPIASAQLSLTRDPRAVSHQQRQHSPQPRPQSQPQRQRTHQRGPADIRTVGRSQSWDVSSRTDHSRYDRSQPDGDPDRRGSVSVSRPVPPADEKTSYEEHTCPWLQIRLAIKVQSQSTAPSSAQFTTKPATTHTDTNHNSNNNNNATNTTNTINHTNNNTNNTNNNTHLATRPLREADFCAICFFHDTRASSEKRQNHTRQRKKQQDTLHQRQQHTPSSASASSSSSSPSSSTTTTTTTTTPHTPQQQQLQHTVPPKKQRKRKDSKS